LKGDILHKICVAIALSAIALTGVAPAQTLSVSSQNVDPNMKLGGTYLGSVVNLPDVYGMYMTNAIRRFTWGADGKLHDTVTAQPGCTENPADPNGIDACGDQIGLFWKHIACNPWYVPCDTNQHWNAAPGQDNITTALPVNGVWPPVINFAHKINYHTINAAFPAPPTTSSQQQCHPNNPGSLATAATSSRVAYEPSTGRWYMVFDANINTPINSRPDGLGLWGGGDAWRLLWAVSTDGGNTWTIDPSFMLRTHRENISGDCGSGFQALDLFIDNNTFYVFFTEIEDKQVYVMKSSVSASQFGYTSWQIANGVSGGFYTWSSPISTTGAATSDFTSTGYNIASGFNACYGPEQFAVSRVFNSSAPNSDWRIIGISSADDPAGCHPVYVGDPVPNNSALRLWITDSIEKPFQPLGLISTPGLQSSSNGWYVSFTHYQDNTSATPRIIGNAFDLWLSGSEGDVRQVTYRATAALHGGIYP
jgi:hypothetical protein